MMYFDTFLGAIRETLFPGALPINFESANKKPSFIRAAAFLVM